MEPAIFQCLGMLSQALGPGVTREMHDALDLIFPWGLSDHLFRLLRVMAEHIPPLLRLIQCEYSRADYGLMSLAKLLDLLSNILTGQPFRPIGAPAPPGAALDVARDINLLQVSGAIHLQIKLTSQASVGGHSPETIALALRTLGVFDFAGTSCITTRSRI
jgi:FKBP12-rapamycin complex-associated protein